MRIYLFPDCILIVIIRIVGNSFVFSSLPLERIHYLLNLFHFDVYHLLGALRSRPLTNLMHFK